MNDFSSDGWQEFLRQISRWRDAWLRRRARRQLWLEESALGELCWMQVDFHPSVESVVGLHSLESEQVRLTNEIAETSEKIDLLREESEKKAASLRAELQETGEQAQPLREGRVSLLEKIDAAGKEMPTFSPKITQMEIASREAEKEHAALMGALGVDVINRRIALEDRRHQLDNALLDLRRQQATRQSEMIAWQNTVASHERDLQMLDAKMARLQAELLGLEKDTKTQVDALQATQKRLMIQRQQIDSGKKEHFQQIGSAIADEKIPPLNQPKALDAVLLCRDKIQALDQQIALSREQSAATASGARRLALLYLIGAILFLACVLTLFGAILVSMVARIFGL